MNKMDRYEEVYRHARAAYGTGAYDDGTLEMLFPQLSDRDAVKREMLNECIDLAAKQNAISQETRETLRAWVDEQDRDGKKWMKEEDYYRDLERVYNDGMDEVREHPERYNLANLGEGWTEDDEKKLCSVITGNYLPLDLRHWFAGLPEKFPFRAAYEWVPSKEQMDALEECKGIVPAAWGVLMDSLYSDLLKYKCGRGTWRK